MKKDNKKDKKDIKEVRAVYKYAKTSAFKARLVAKQIYRKPVEKALNILSFSNKKAAVLIKQTLNSAISNVEHNDAMDIDELKVTSIYIDEGSTRKKTRARAKGRMNKIFKRTSHITIGLSENTK